MPRWLRRLFEPRNHLAGGVTLTRGQFRAAVKAARSGSYIKTFAALRDRGVPIATPDAEYPARNAARAIYGAIQGG